MLEISHIQKKYGKKIILEDITLRAECGECIAIVGRNGCGKTTLMQILAGARKPDGGELRFFGKDPLAKQKFFRKYVGYVPQEPPLLEELSVKDNLKLWGVFRSEYYPMIEETFELKDMMSTKVQKLSGGMKRRLGIACAVAFLPPILLLDEPTTALDFYYKDSIWQWLQQYRKMNGIILLTSHEEKEILSCDRCVVMDHGTLSELTEGNFTIEEIKKIINE